MISYSTLLFQTARPQKPARPLPLSGVKSADTRSRVLQRRNVNFAASSSGDQSSAYEVWLVRE